MAANTMESLDLLGTTEAARVLRLSVHWLRALDKQRRLVPAVRLSSGTRLYTRQQLEEFDAQRAEKKARR